MINIEELNELQLYWYKTGKYLGYPECCIESFIKMDSRTEEQSKVHNHHGFIPCHKHAVEILKGKTTLKEIIQNRQHSEPFPNLNRKEFESFQKTV